MHERQVVHHRAHVREELGDELAALAVALELERAAHERAGVALPHPHPAFARQGLAVVLFEHRFVVERVHVADAAAHEQRNDRLGARLEVWVPRGRRRCDALCVAGSLGRQQAFLLEHVSQRDAADALAGAEQEVAA